jgi:hypothetical protein
LQNAPIRGVEVHPSRFSLGTPVTLEGAGGSRRSCEPAHTYRDEYAAAASMGNWCRAVARSTGSKALAGGVHSADVVLNILARHRNPAPVATILTPDALRLQYAPIADCARYDRLRRAG